VACGAPAHAAAPADFPSSFAPAPLAAWIKSNTSLPFAAIGSVSTSGVVAVLPARPERQDLVKVRLWVETLDPILAQAEGALSWSSEAVVDCRERRLRFGAATGFSRRNRQGSAVRTTAPDALWRTPSAGEPSDAIWRAACGRPVVTAFSKSPPATADAASPAPPPATAPQPSGAPPSAASSPTQARRAAFAVQLAALAGATPTEPVIGQVRSRFGGLIGAYPVGAVRVRVGGRPVQRLLVMGLPDERSAQRLCADLRAAGQICLVRRMALDANDALARPSGVAESASARP
jgi:hypothetical protein